jgi:peptidoglycan hydrolase CwlO-like protein
MSPLEVQIACAVVTCIVAVITIISTSRKTNKNEGEHSGQISSDLGYLKKGVEDINTKIEKSNEKHYELVEKVGRLDESVKSAHHRIDTLEENIKGENK